jgi:hypothetical protein
VSLKDERGTIGEVLVDQLGIAAGYYLSGSQLIEAGLLGILSAGSPGPRRTE